MNWSSMNNVDALILHRPLESVNAVFGAMFFAKLMRISMTVGMCLSFRSVPVHNKLQTQSQRHYAGSTTTTRARNPSGTPWCSWWVWP